MCNAHHGYISGQTNARGKKSGTKMQARNKLTETTTNSDTMNILVISFLIATLTTTSFTMPTPASLQTCTCNIGKGKFRGCKEINPTSVWGNHYDNDIGLHTSCLPPVPEK